MSEEFCHRKEEYLSLRKEIEGSLSDLSTLENNSLLAIAAVYSWLASQGTLDHFFKLIAASSPVFIAVFGALRAYSVNKHLGLIGLYIKRVEAVTRSGDSDFSGWEHFFEKASRGDQTKVRIGFWFILAAATLLVLALSWRNN